LRKGFFDKPKTRAAEAEVPGAEASQQAHVSSGSFGSTDASLGAGKVSHDDAGPDELIEGLRSRIRAATESAAAREQRVTEEEAAVASAREGQLEKELAALQVRWPSSQTKTSAAKAAKEIDNALAEMRVAANDARRLRSGDERRAMTDLRRAAEDVRERVLKVAEEAAKAKGSEKDRAAAAVAAFHALPLTAKLRTLADEKVAAALMGASFLGGMALVLGFALEVYSAWDCGLRCSR